MFPTPSTSHLSFDNIYPPSEDSYLLLDIISSPAQTAYLTSRFSSPPHTITPTPLILEVGTGSGILTSFITSHADAIFGRDDVVTLATDVNPYACTACAETVEVNNPASGTAGKRFVGVVMADLTSPMRGGSVDVLLFNPPYVPSEFLPSRSAGMRDDEDTFLRDSRFLALATDGGDQGMEVTNHLLDQLDEVLERRRGVAYVLFCARNGVDKIVGQWRGKMMWGGGNAWEVDVVGESGGKGGWERLKIVRFARATSNDSSLSLESSA